MKTLTLTSASIRKGFIWINQVMLIFIVFACNEGCVTETCEELGNCPPQTEFDYLSVRADVNQVTEENGITYGTNNPYNTVDVIEVPENVDNARPLILLSPGGAFKYFNRVEDLKRLGRNLAQRGYVVGIVRYNIDAGIENTNTAAMQRKWLEGIIDQKTAIRYFKTNASAYRIDPEKIFIGGWSNGGQLALNTATFQEDEVATIENENMRTAITALVEEMGLEGTDHMNVTSTVKGALMLNIYSFDLNSFDANDPAMMFIHHNESRIPSLEIPTIGTFKIGDDTFYGPQPITAKAKTVGYTEGADLEFITMTGQGYIPFVEGLNYHEPNFAALCSLNFDKIAQFFHTNIQ